MPVRLIDPEATTDIIVSGTTFTVRQLTHGQVIRLSKAQERFLNMGEDADRAIILNTLADVVVACDHPNADCVDGLFDFLGCLCLEDFLTLSVEVANLSTLNRSESKN